MRIMLLCLLLLAAVPARPAESAVTNHVVVELEDGCIIVGRLSVTALSFESQLLGKMQIPLERIASIEGKESNQTILMRNGDTIQASLAEQELQMETVFGKLKVPRRQILALKCRQEK